MKSTLIDVWLIHQSLVTRQQVHSNLSNMQECGVYFCVQALVSLRLAGMNNSKMQQNSFSLDLFWPKRKLSFKHSLFAVKPFSYLIYRRSTENYHNPHKENKGKSLLKTSWVLRLKNWLLSSCNVTNRCLFFSKYVLMYLAAAQSYQHHLFLKGIKGVTLWENKAALFHIPKL